MSKANQQHIKARYNLSGYKQADIQYSEIGDRSYVEFNGYSSAVISNPKRRPDLRKKLVSTPLRSYIAVREVWFRNFEIRDLAINQFKNSRRNADPAIRGSWCVTFKDPIARLRYIIAYVDGRKYIDIHNS